MLNGRYNNRKRGDKQVSYGIPARENALSPDMKIILLSDLHLGALRSEKNHAKIVREINASKPDLVCPAGLPKRALNGMLPNAKRDREGGNNIFHKKY